MVLPQDESNNENPNQPSEGDGAPLPDWMSSDAAPESSSEEGASGTPGADMPDWLQEATAAEPASADMPDCIRESANSDGPTFS